MCNIWTKIPLMLLSLLITLQVSAAGKIKTCDASQLSCFQNANIVSVDTSKHFTQFAENRRYHRYIPPNNNRYQNKKRDNNRLYTKQKRQKRHYAKQRARSVPPMTKKIESTGNRTFVFDPKILQWGAYDEEGDLIKSGRASGGKNYCPDIGRRCLTPSGEFNVYRKGSAHCKSRKFPLGRGGAPMPHCMFFKGGYAVHGSPDVPDYNASHGCIRVLPTAAKWLHQNFIQHGTTVIVKPY